MEIEYPCLMQNKETSEIVLFTSRQSGMVVIPSEKTDRPLGYSSRVWAMSWFEPFGGKLTVEKG